MTACEQCWNDAYVIARMSGRTQPEVYRELLDRRTHEDGGDQDGDRR